MYTNTIFINICQFDIVQNLCIRTINLKKQITLIPTIIQQPPGINYFFSEPIQRSNKNPYGTLSKNPMVQVLWYTTPAQKYQQNYSMPSENPSLSQSKMEATFVANSTLKRNKRYFDVERLNDLEHDQQVQRRRPYSSGRNVEDKINRSFSNSTAAFTERLEKDIHRFRSRFEPRPQSEDTRRRSYSRESSKSVRGVGIGQHLSREQFYKVKSKPVLDERLFNNFYLEEPDIAHTADLGNGPERDFDNSLKNMNDIAYQTQKLYQDYYYRRTTMDCRFHYKKQKQTEREFFVTARPENKPATELSPKAVKRSEDYVHKKPGPIDSFYMNSGRELPCQLQARSGTKLTSHWRNSKEKIERPNIQYSVRCMKEKLEGDRKDRIKKSKKPQFHRKEICDKKFFIINGDA